MRWGMGSVEHCVRLWYCGTTVSELVGFGDDTMPGVFVLVCGSEPCVVSV